MSLVHEKAHAISCHYQRNALNKDAELGSVLAKQVAEDHEGLATALEAYLRTCQPDLASIITGVVGQPGDIVENGEKAEDGDSGDGDGKSSAKSAPSPSDLRVKPRFGR